MYAPGLIKDQISKASPELVHREPTFPSLPIGPASGARGHLSSVTQSEGCKPRASPPASCGPWQWDYSSAEMLVHTAQAEVIFFTSCPHLRARTTGRTAVPAGRVREVLLAPRKQNWMSPQDSFFFQKLIR